MCNIWSRPLQMLLLLGGHMGLPMVHEDGQEGGVHSTRGHRAVGLSLTSGDPQVSWGVGNWTKLCSWTKSFERIKLSQNLALPPGWVALPRPTHSPRSHAWLPFSWNPTLRSNLSPNERQAVVFLGHCLLSLLFSLPCSSLCTFPCPCPSPLISKEEELSFGSNMNIKSQCRGLWNPTYIKADAARVWQCSVVPLVVSSQRTAVKNLSQLESFMCLSFTFWIFCCDWSYYNFPLFQSSVGWNLWNSTPKNMMIQNIYFPQ